MSVPGAVGRNGQCPCGSDRMPCNFHWLGLFHLAFPRGRVMHIRRNPLDTRLSIHAMPFAMHQPYTGQQGDLGYYYRQYVVDRALAPL